MSNPFVGEVRLVGFNFAPQGWAFCDGSTQSIAENDTLFNLIGTTYGGDGQSTFNLPDLRGRTPVHQGSSGGSTYIVGAQGGVEQVTVSISQYPTHTHAWLASQNTTGGVNSPANAVLINGQSIYSASPPAIAMNANAVGLSGGGNQPHANLQPYQVLNWVISLFGIFPSQG